MSAMTTTRKAAGLQRRHDEAQVRLMLALDAARAAADDLLALPPNPLIQEWDDTTDDTAHVLWVLDLIASIYRPVMSPDAVLALKQARGQRV